MEKKVNKKFKKQFKKVGKTIQKKVQEKVQKKFNKVQKKIHKKIGRVLMLPEVYFRLQAKQNEKSVLVQTWSLWVDYTTTTTTADMQRQSSP